VQSIAIKSSASSAKRFGAVDHPFLTSMLWFNWRL